MDSKEVKIKSTDYVEETGFKGRAPTFSEAQVAVRMAGFLPELVDVNGG